MTPTYNPSIRHVERSLRRPRALDMGIAPQTRRPSRGTSGPVILTCNPSNSAAAVIVDRKPGGLR